MHEITTTDAQRPIAIQFAIGRVLSDSLKIYGRNFVPFFLLSALVQSLSYIESLLVWAGVSLDPESWAYLLSTLVRDVFISAFVTATISYGTFQGLRGQPAGLLSSIRQIAMRLLPILGAVLIYSICVGLGFAIFVVPGLLMAVIWWVYIPVLIVERGRTLACFSRSSQLTARYRWHILGILLICGFTALGAESLIAMVVEMRDGALIAAALQHISNALFLAFNAVTVAVGYYQLRAEKEGAGIEEIASVFD